MGCTNGPADERARACSVCGRPRGARGGSRPHSLNRSDPMILVSTPDFVSAVRCRAKVLRGGSPELGVRSATARNSESEVKIQATKETVRRPSPWAATTAPRGSVRAMGSWRLLFDLDLLTHLNKENDTYIRPLPFCSDHRTFSSEQRSTKQSPKSTPHRL